MKFNMNDCVKVKLTIKGREAHRKNHENLIMRFPNLKLKYVPPKEDDEGYSKWQLWCLMEEFGKHVHIGMDSLFDSDIETIEN